MIIHAPSYSFFLLNIVTLILCYAKFEGDLFFFNMTMTFSPTLLFLVLQTVRYLKRVIMMDEETVKDKFAASLNEMELIDNLFHFIMSLFITCFCIYFIHRYDYSEKNLPKAPLYILVLSYLLSQVVYSFISKSKKNELLLPMSDQHNKQESSLMTIILTPIFNFLSSTIPICAGGTCSTIYGSTISAIGSAFGISISEWLPYLDGVTLILVFVSVYILYYAKQSFTYPPFLLGLVGAILIVPTSLFTSMRIPIYLGNVLMIAAAIWNSRLNKASMMGLFGKGKHLA
jgi:hypothetical protein